MMTDNAETEFEMYLARHDEGAWAGAVAELLPSIHEVDRNATQIWFAFYPLAQDLFGRALQKFLVDVNFARRGLERREARLPDGHEGRGRDADD